jgi:hypothetical protein
MTKRTIIGLTTLGALFYLTLFYLITGGLDRQSQIDLDIANERMAYLQAEVDKLQKAALPKAGTYYFMTPRSGFENFIWIADTRTGRVGARRFVRVTEDNKPKGKFLGFRIEVIEHEPTELDRLREMLAKVKK